MKYQFIAMNKNQKVKIQYTTKIYNKNTTNEFRLFVLVYSNEDAGSRRFKAKRYYLPKGIIDNHSFIINGKKFYDQAIDSDVNRYEEFKKSTTEQGQDYTTGRL